MLLKKAPKRKFTLEEKKRLYFEWKAGNLTKSKFCKEKGVALSDFSQWCQIFSVNGRGVSAKKSAGSMLDSIGKASEEPVLVEIRLPTGMVFSTSLNLPCLLSLLTDVGQRLQQLSSKKPVS